MARVEGGAVILETDWPGLKAQIDNRNVNFKFEEDASAYEIFAIDGQYFYKTIIYKAGEAPQNQATFDAWRIDFETNYKDRITDFSSTQPFYMSNVDGYSVVLKDGAAPTANDGYGIALIGYDGSNYRMLKSDSSGRPILVGAGAAGSPAGGVISIQGVVGGTSIPISGSITAVNDSVGLTGSTTPASATLIGGTDGTNLQPARFFDLDTGGGQQFVLGVGLRKASGGGSVEAGTSSDPIRIDPTGTTIQPVSGTVTANAGSGTFTIGGTITANIGTTNGLALDATLVKLTIAQSTALGSNTQALVGASVTTAAPSYTNGNINPLSLTTAGALRIDGSAVTQPISGAVTANAGTGNFTVVQSTASNLRAQLASESATGSGITSTAVMVAGSDGTNLRAIFVDTSGRSFVVGGAANGAAVAGNPVLIAGSDGTNARSIRTATDGTIRIDPTGTTAQPITDNAGSLTVDNPTLSVVGGGAEATSLRVTIANDSTGLISIDDNGSSLTIDTTQLPSSLIGGRLDTNVGAWLGSTAPTIGQKTMANSVPITISSDQSAIPVSQSGTWTVQQGTPPWSVIGPDAAGAAVSGNPVRIGGSDGTNTRDILTDTSGRQVMVGAAAAGATVTGNPVLMGGQDGTNVKSILTDTAGRIVTVSAASAATNGFSNGEIVLSSTTVTAIRSTTYTEPSSGAQRSMASSNANDTSAGTGARTVIITYYTLSAGTVAGPFTETITLNGTSNVNTVATNICYIEKLKVLTVGSGGVNAGTITLFGATAGNGGTVWTIATGVNKTFGAHHYVPSSTICSITTFNGGIKGADTSGFILRAKDPTNANAAELQINDLLRAPSSGNTPVRPYTAPLKITGPSRITAFAIPDSSSSRTYYASFDFYEE